MPKRPSHPSGRPVRRRIIPKDRRPVLNVPQDEPLTPGLRHDRNVEAIGFHHMASEPEEEDGE